MKKPDSLRAALTETFPEFERDPNRLRLWIEEGGVCCWAGESDISFSLKYKLTVVIEGWTQSQLLIWVVLLDWLRIQQPDLVTASAGDQAVPFEADLIAADETDISFDLALTEPIEVTRRADGGFDMRTIGEPDPLFPDFDPFVPDGMPLKELTLTGATLDGELLTSGTVKGEDHGGADGSG